MAKLDLTKYGITGTTEVVHNPSYEQLFAEETNPELEGYEKGQVSELGAVNVMEIPSRPACKGEQEVCLWRPSSRSARTRFRGKPPVAHGLRNRS